MKKIISVLLCITLMGMMVVGCSKKDVETKGKSDTSNSSSDNNSSKKKEDKVTLRFMGYNAESSRVSYLQLLADQLPNIEIQYEFVPGDNFDSVLNTQLSAGNAPDIIEGGSSTILLASAGYVKDLTNEAFISRYHQDSFKSFSVDNKIYGVPLQSWFSGIYYNKKFFRDNNLEIPKTVSEYITLSKKIKELNKIPEAFPFADGNNLAVQFFGLSLTEFYSKPESVDFNEKFNKAEVTLDGNWNQIGDIFNTYLEEGIITQDDLGVSAEQALELFVTEQAVMFRSGPWDVNTFKEKNPDLELGMFPIVGTDPMQRWLVGGTGSSLMVNSKTDKLDAVLQVLDLTSTPEAQAALIKDNMGSSFLKGVDVEMDSIYDDCKDTFKNNYIHCPWVAWKAGTPDLVTLGKSLQEVVAGGKTVDEALQDTDRKNKEVISSLE